MRYTMRYIPHAMRYAMRTVPACYAMCYAMHCAMPCAHAYGTAMVYRATPYVLALALTNAQCIMTNAIHHDQHNSYCVCCCLFADSMHCNGPRRCEGIAVTA